MLNHAMNRNVVVSPNLIIHLEAVEVVVVVVLVTLLSRRGARVPRRRVGGGRARRARRSHAVDRAVEAVSVDLQSDEKKNVMFKHTKLLQDDKFLVNFERIV